MGAELFYRRLMSVVDDFGRYDARISLLRSSCYPVSFDKVSKNDVEEWLNECVKKGIIKLYDVDNKSYIEIINFGQRLRKKISKYPQDTANDGNVLTNDSKCRLEEKRSRREVEVEGKTSFRKDDAVAVQFLLNEYPKKSIHPLKAKRAVSDAIVKVGVPYLMKKVSEFVKASANTERQYIPSPDKFFDNEQYDMDMGEWSQMSKNNKTQGTPEMSPEEIQIRANLEKRRIKNNT